MSEHRFPIHAILQLWLRNKSSVKFRKTAINRAPFTCEVSLTDRDQILVPELMLKKPSGPIGEDLRLLYFGVAVAALIMHQRENMPIETV